MAQITLQDVAKVYPNEVTALAQTSLDVADGEFLVLVGPSGSGKTTLLRMVAGLEDVTAGRIRIGDHDVTDLPPERRDIAMVFQNYALYPNMSVAQNLAFGLRMRGTAKEERTRRVAEVAKVLGLEELLARRPGQLSGGQRQRVAMGRAMVREPAVFLMDEPLSNLDAKLRVSMRAELKRLHERLGVTTVYVTHDQVEATTLGQRVAVLRDGRLQQCDTPQQLFDHPANLFVAAFIGSPSMNLVEVEIADGHARFAEHALRLPAGAPAARRAILGFRPTDLRLLEEGEESDATLAVQVDVVENLGTESIVIFVVNAPPITVERTGADGGDSQEGWLLAGDERAKLTARLGGRHRLRPGDRVRFAVDVDHAHFFDCDDGTAISWRSPAEPVGSAPQFDLPH
jgi:multiple sugar transport system ATP-binding protein